VNTGHVKNNMSRNLTGLKVRIETPLFEECIKFYGETLGLTIVEQWNKHDDRGVIFGLDLNKNSKAFLELGYIQETKDCSGLSIQIRVDSLLVAIDKLSGAVKFNGPVGSIEERPWGSKYLRLTDPAGVSVILYEGTL